MPPENVPARSSALGQPHRREGAIDSRLQILPANGVEFTEEPEVFAVSSG